MLVVGTWNLENFFLPGGEAGPKDHAAYDAKVGHLAATIEAIAPDVLAVQEVGQPEALEDLRARLGQGWHAAVSEHPDQRGIRVGFLSQLPFAVTEDVQAFPDGIAAIQQSDDGPTEHAMGRGALHARIEHDRQPVDLVTCHLKSKLLSFPGHNQFQPHDEDQRARYSAYALYRRAAEAATIRCYADALLDGHGQQRALVVLGDLNDGPEAATTQMLLGPPGSQFKTGGYGHADKGDAWRLWSLAPLIPEDVGAYSRKFAGQPELIDHILVSHKLADDDTDVTVHHQTAASIGVDPRVRRDQPASDHDPVVAHLANA